jgi:hypothetical protein
VGGSWLIDIDYEEMTVPQLERAIAMLEAMLTSPIVIDEKCFIGPDGAIGYLGGAAYVPDTPAAQAWARHITVGQPSTMGTPSPSDSTAAPLQAELPAEPTLSPCQAIRKSVLSASANGPAGPK